LADARENRERAKAALAARFAANDADACNQGTGDDAIAACSHAIERNPKNADAYNKRGYAYYLNQQYDRAIADFDQAITLDPKNADAFSNRGDAYRYGKDDDDRAIADYGQAIALAPNNANYYRDRGWAYEAKREYDRAIADYNQMIALDPNDAFAYRTRGFAYLARGDYDRAIADYSQAMRLKPDDHFYSFRGEAYAGKGDHDRAIADFDALARLDPDNAGQAHFGRSMVWRLKGDYGRAIAELDESIKLEPKSAIAYSTRGEAWRLKGDYDRAIADLNQAIELEPEIAFAYIARGIAYNKKGAYDRAIADIDQAITRLDRHQRRDENEAIAHFDQLLRLPPRNAVAYNARGESYAGKGDYARAIVDYDQALKLYPGLADARQNRDRAQAALAAPQAAPKKPDAGAGAATAPAATAPAAAGPGAAPAAAADAVACARGTGDDVIAACSRVLDRDPGNAAAYNSRGSAYAGRGDYDRAIADFDQALKLNPGNAAAYAGRGKAHDARGEHGRAIADYDQALMFDPGNAAVRQSREHAQTALASLPGPAAKRPETAGPQTTSPSVPPQRRVALVIGNSAYSGVPALANPQRDARAVADALRQAGFQTVELKMDLDRAGMVAALRAFRAQADRADWALVYFAGHGIEIDRVNYLIPIDAKLDDDRDVKEEAVSYETVLNATGNARALKLIILDACRKNPFKDRMHRSTAMRSTVDRGLAPPPEPEAGTLIAYSARDGQVAADDVDGANSPFARAFIAQLKVPGLEVRRLFEFVRDDVMEATGRRQQPFTYQSLPGRQEFFFVAGK
jgi:tetratricopeptide (TPR) repeat protein